MLTLIAIVSLYCRVVCHRYLKYCRVGLIENLLVRWDVLCLWMECELVPPLGKSVAASAGKATASGTAKERSEGILLFRRSYT
jgi:hypothetical protein